MTTIDASKSQVLPQLFRKLVIALSQLSNADVEMHQVITKLNLLRGNLVQLPVEETLAAVDTAAHLVQGYELGEMKADEFTKSLPQVIEGIKDELDYLLTEARILGKTSSELLGFARFFEKLAGK